MPRFKLYASADAVYTVEVEAEDYDDAQRVADGLDWTLEGTPVMTETTLIKNLDTGEEREYS